MSQEQTKRQGGGGGDDEDGTGAEASGQERREKLGEDVDTILDEIDDVLEENAKTSSAPTFRRAASNLASRSASGPRVHGGRTGRVHPHPRRRRS